MSDYVIKVENLGKKYRIQHRLEQQQYVALRDVITDGAMALLGWLRSQNAKRTAFSNNGASQNGGVSCLETDLRPQSSDLRYSSSEDFWALREVSFEVKRGEVVGIIGRNGAGKSTLLKILSRITEPTEGRVRIRGRVASLLEVGTGFHPELTGRENIFVNGAILGMTRAEIQRNFDEIVAFAEVETFLDTPVKRYSSGMYVRLAFAVAAHLDPEILIVDEVLAVGDVEFQKKCLGKMEDVSKGGRTIIFVSHNMAAVRRLCNRGILLNEGRVVTNGETNTVINSYVDHAPQAGRTGRHNFRSEPGRSHPAFKSVEIRNARGQVSSTILAGEPFEVVLTLHNPLPTSFSVIIGVEVLDNEGVSLFTSHSDDMSGKLVELPPGASTATCAFKANPLMPGNYSLQLGLVDRNWSLLDLGRPKLGLFISEVPDDSLRFHLARPGRLFLELPWKLGDE